MTLSKLPMSEVGICKILEHEKKTCNSLEEALSVLDFSLYQEFKSWEEVSEFLTLDFSVSGMTMDMPISHYSKQYILYTILKRFCNLIYIDRKEGHFIIKV